VRIFFLGTGAAEGFPALFSNTPINQEARRRGGKNLRLRSGILINEKLRVDLSPDALAQVHKYAAFDPSKIEHLLFTHTHDDHFAVRELQYLSPTFAPDRETPLSIYITDENKNKIIPAMAHFFEAAPLRFHALTPFVPIRIAELTVTPITAHHKADELCLNFIFDDGKKRLLYASDTGWYDAQTWAFLDGYTLDGCIVECGKGISQSSYDGHLSLDDCIAMKEKLALTPDAFFYLTHLSHTGELLHEELTEQCAPHGIQVAYDGLSLTL
jgi:phosphoribosyl 1,2-cyclic phosphate phosphodiesterase